VLLLRFDDGARTRPASSDTFPSRSPLILPPPPFLLCLVHPSCILGFV
jgi:hypothetical protein